MPNNLEEKRNAVPYPQFSIKLTTALIAQVRLSFCFAAKQTRKHVLTQQSPATLNLAGHLSRILAQNSTFSPGVWKKKGEEEKEKHKVDGENGNQVL